MLNLIDETLHQMPFFVPMFVVLTLLLAMSSWWDDRFSPLCGNKLQNLVGIIRFVGQHSVIVVAIHQGFSLGRIMRLTWGQNEAQWVAQGINADMDFRAEPTTTATQSLFSLTAVFLKHQRRRDAPARWCYPKSSFPYLGHRQSVCACFARPACRPSARSVCRRCSSYRISLVTPATGHQCAESSARRQ
jgi:hypothetical protein